MIITYLFMLFVFLCWWYSASIFDLCLWQFCFFCTPASSFSGVAWCAVPSLGKWKRLCQPFLQFPLFKKKNKFKSSIWKVYLLNQTEKWKNLFSDSARNSLGSGIFQLNCILFLWNCTEIWAKCAFYFLERRSARPSRSCSNVLEPQSCSAPRQLVLCSGRTQYSAQSAAAVAAVAAAVAWEIRLHCHTWLLLHLHLSPPHTPPSPPNWCPTQLTGREEWGVGCEGGRSIGDHLLCDESQTSRR